MAFGRQREDCDCLGQVVVTHDTFSKVFCTWMRCKQDLRILEGETRLS
jgi:hypothetical protein